MDYMAIISSGVYPVSPTSAERASYAVSLGLLGSFPSAVARSIRRRFHLIMNFWDELKL